MENTVKRITKAQKFEDVIALLNGNPATFIDKDGAVEFIRNEMALLAKKNASDSHKPTAVQEANEKFKAFILEFLSTQTEGRTCTEVAKSVPALSDFNNQKVAALMRQLVDAGKVSKATVKGNEIEYGTLTKISVYKNQLPTPYNITYNGTMCCVHSGIISEDDIPEYKKKEIPKLLEKLNLTDGQVDASEITFSEVGKLSDEVVPVE